MTDNSKYCTLFFGACNMCKIIYTTSPNNSKTDKEDSLRDETNGMN